jgi:hypothetical protein
MEPTDKTVFSRLLQHLAVEAVVQETLQAHPLVEVQMEHLVVVVVLVLIMVQEAMELPVKAQMVAMDPQTSQPLDAAVEAVEHHQLDQTEIHQPRVMEGMERPLL